MSSQASLIARPYKQGMKNDEARRKREDNMISLRKVAREEHTQKRRALINTPTPSVGIELRPISNQSVIDNTVNDQMIPEIPELPRLIADLKSQNQNHQLEAVKTFRQLLSKDAHPPIDAVIASGVVPQFVKMLYLDQNLAIQYDAAWALTNIASGNSKQTKSAIDAGCLEAFVRLLACSQDAELRELVVWALGNIAGDSPQLRDRVIDTGVLDLFLKFLVPSAKLSMIQMLVWAISNLCRKPKTKGASEPNFDVIRRALPHLVSLLNEHKDVEVLADVCWSLSYMSDDPDGEEGPKISAVLKAGAAHGLVRLLNHPSQKVRAPVVRTVGNIVSGNTLQTEAILNAGGLLELHNSLCNRYLESRNSRENKHDKNAMRRERKEVCWAISNIMAGPLPQIRQVVEQGSCPQLIKLMSSGDHEIQKEACWAMYNATAGALAADDKLLIKEFANMGLIKSFLDLIEKSDPKMILVCLDGIDNMLKSHKLVGTQDNEMKEKLEEDGGIDILENLQNNKNEEVYNRVQSLLKEYFTQDEGDNINHNNNRDEEKKSSISASILASNFQSNTTQMNKKIEFRDDAVVDVTDDEGNVNINRSLSTSSLSLPLHSNTTFPNYFSSSSSSSSFLPSSFPHVSLLQTLSSPSLSPSPTPSTTLHSTTLQSQSIAPLLPSINPFLSNPMPMAINTSSQASAEILPSLSSNPFLAFAAPSTSATTQSAFTCAFNF